MGDVANAAYVLRPSEGRSIDLGAIRMSVKTAGEQTKGAFSLLGADEPAGFGPPMRIHRDAAEAFSGLVAGHGSPPRR